MRSSIKRVAILPFLLVDEITETNIVVFVDKFLVLDVLRDIFSVSSSRRNVHVYTINEMFLTL